MQVPLVAQHTVGRIFGDDWTIANVAKLLRAKAREGNLRLGPLTGDQWQVQQDYLRITSARHLPSGVAATFRRDAASAYQAELCFADLDHYLPWREALAEQWLTALFQEDRPRVREIAADPAPLHPGRRFELSG